MRMREKIIVSIIRNKVRTILLLILSMMLTGLISVSLITIRATEYNANTLHRRMPRTLMLEWTSVAWDSLGYPLPGAIMLEAIHDLRKRSEIAYFDYSVSYFMHNRIFERYLITDRYERFPNAELDAPLIDSLSLARRGLEGLEIFYVQGVQKPDFFALRSGEIEIIQGRTFTLDEIEQNKPVVVISEPFAGHNGLTIGDSFDLEMIVHESGDDITSDLLQFFQFYGDPPTLEVLLEGARIYEFPSFEVIGIFELVSTLNAEIDWQNFMWTNIRLNNFYLPAGIVEQAYQFRVQSQSTVIFDDDSTLAQTLTVHDPVFLLADGVDAREFTMTVNDQLPQELRLRDLSNSFSGFFIGFETINNFAIRFLVLGIAAALIVLSLTVTLLLYSRKNEIIIYRAMGEKKLNLIVQFTSEIMLIALVGGIIGLFIGNIVATHISNEMLRTELIAHASDVDRPWQEMFVPMALAMHNPTIDELMELYVVPLRAVDVVQFLMLNMGVAFVASGVPVFFMIKSNLKQSLEKGSIG